MSSRWSQGNDRSVTVPAAGSGGTPRDRSDVGETSRPADWTETPWPDAGATASSPLRRPGTWLSLILGVLVIGFVAVRLAASRGWPVAVAVAVMGLAVLGLSVFRWPEIPRRIGHGARVAVSGVLFSVLGVFAVVVPWLLRPLTGVRRFSSPGGGTEWRPLSPRPVQSERPWMVSGHWEGRTVRERWQPRIAGCAVLVVVAVLVWNRAQPEGPAPRNAYNLTKPGGVARSGPEIPAAYADSPWYPRLQRDLEYGATWLGSIQLIDGQRLPDFRSEYLNVDDGYRRSWVPPACSCRRLAVWVYGASTVFGLGQRDDHTIVSELARAAWKDGIALDVSNKGIPGEEHWQEANRLRWDLTRNPAPDVVVFYDGASDIVGASWINERRLPDLERPVEPLTEGFLSSPGIEDALTKAKTGGQEQPPLPEGAWVAPKAEAPERTPAEVGELAATRYARARIMSQDLAAIHDLDVHWFWQPTRLSRPPVKGEPTSDLDDDSRATVEAARADLPSGVVDLSDALDGVDEPIFSDDAHHNEEGARIIATRIYRSLASDLDELASRKPGS